MDRNARQSTDREPSFRREQLVAEAPDGYWTLAPDALFERFKSGPSGLSTDEAARRLAAFGKGDVIAKRSSSRLRILWRQVSNPLLWLLMMAAALSAGTGEWSDAVIVLTIVVVTVGLGYTRERGATRALEMLEARVRTTTTVLRDGVPVSVPRDAIVIGDVVLLSAGSLVPADGVVFQTSHCFVSEALLTGESFSIEKREGAVPLADGLSQRTNCVYLGTNVQSGTASCLVVATGTATEFAKIAAHLRRRAPETDFDRGIRRFGYLLTIAMLLLTFLVFVIHVLNGRPPIETLLFSVALAVGLSPELLPAILSVNLTRGAQSMAHRGVLVRRLTAIENLGSMDVLCTDKTGTLTEGAVRLDGAYDWTGASSTWVLELGAINAALQTGLRNPLDEALLEARRPDLAGISKVAEIPFDFSRKRIGLVVDGPNGRRLVVKGAFERLIGACSTLPEGRPIDASVRSGLVATQEAWSREGTRVIAVASRPVATQTVYSSDDEVDLRFEGFLTFLDRPKPGVAEALGDLNRLGVSVKIITGDNRLVSQHVAGLVGLRADRMLTGAEITAMSGAALWQAAPRTDLFVEVDPAQKEQVILALKKSGHVVGFMGDGVNDAPAMHSADTSISVEGAVDVAREAADFVLLERDLDVLRGGIEEGRRTFANTLKYILTTMSANLGNMMSMAFASLVLPFLPLLAGQILLNNMLSDIPAIGIADDSVDPEMVQQPPRWDMTFIARFMVEFGVLSSLFDMLTFGLLLWRVHASIAAFRTGWFVESLLSELAVALVVRTQRPFFRSRPGTLLLTLTSVLAAVAVAIPYLPFAGVLGFTPLPLTVLASMVGITVAYVGAAELGKLWFYRKRVLVQA